jgi:intracellular sulfur oxidation DsrE/DsrF family protein
MEKYKVVFHINESSRWSVLLANINNLIKDLGKENIIIEVVSNGAAVVDYVQNSDKDFINKVREAANLGVGFAVCRNSLIGNKIEEKLIESFIKVVPAGVTEIIKKQAEGYGYIKP